MLLFRRHVKLLGTDVSRNFSAACDRYARVYVARASQAIVDLRALPDTVCGGPPGRNSCLVILEGEYTVFRLTEKGLKAVTLLPGDTLSEPASVRWDRWVGNTFAVLVLEWQCSQPVERSFGHVSSMELQALRQFAHALEHQTITHRLELRDLTIDIAEHLVPDRSCELWHWLDLARKLPEPAEVAYRNSLDHTSAALGTIVSNLHDTPMWIDLAPHLELGERQGRRLLGELLPMLGATSNRLTLRSYLNTLRLNHAASFLASKAATVRQVAASLGYGSGRALATALQNAGLPGPTELGKAVQHGDFQILAQN